MATSGASLEASSSGLLLPPAVHAEVQRLLEFVRSELQPWELEMEADEAGAQVAHWRQRVSARSRELGFFGMTQPRRFGGSEAGPLLLTALQEALASANLRTLHRFVFGPGPGILAGATGRLASEYLDPVLRGEKVGAFGFTEPDQVPRRTYAIREGPDLIITGQKSYVTGGNSADFVNVLVNVEGSPDKKQPKGTAMVVVDRHAAGVVVERVFHSMDGGEAHAFMRFNAVRVPDWQVVGAIGEGMPRALGAIGNTRMFVAAQAAGLASWALQHIAAHVQKPHRTGSPLGSHEGVQLRLGDMAIDVAAARALLLQTATLLETTRDKKSEAAVAQVKMTKIFCTEACGRVVDAAVQLVGGEALVAGHPMERLYRSVRAMRLIEGASDLLRLQVAKAAMQAAPLPRALPAKL